MAITITGPDGASIDFPDGTSQAEMTAAMQQAYLHQNDATSPPAAPQSSGISGAVKGASRALEGNLPFVDRAVAGAQSVLPQGYGGTGQDYATNLAAERAKNAQFAEQNPWTSSVGGLTAYAPLALVGGAGSLGARVGQSALANFGLGGLQGASSSPDLTNTQDTGRRIAQGELTGGTIGALIPPAAVGVGRIVSPLARALSKGPDASGLADDVTAAYQRVRDMGAGYAPEKYQALVDKIAADAQADRINPGLHPGASGVIADMQKAAASGKPVDLPMLDQDRQIAGQDAWGSPREAHFGRMIRSNIDDFIAKAEPQTAMPKPPVAPVDYNAPRAAAVDEAKPSQVTGSSLVPARKMSDGSIKYGEPGQVHSDLLTPDETSTYYTSTPGEMGFATPEGEFLNRSQAAKFVGEGIAGRSALDHYGLEAGSYRDALAMEPPATTSIAPPAPAPSAQDAADAIRTAHDLAMRQFKANALADALDKAKVRADVSGTGGNIENATRQRLAAILPKEPWSPDEMAQINAMVHGTPVTNALRQVSRLSPVGNVLTLMLEGGGALGTGSPLPLVAAMAGAGAQAAGAIARRNAQRQVLSTILAGGKAPVVPLPNSYGGALAGALASRPLLPQQENTNP